MSRISISHTNDPHGSLRRSIVIMNTNDKPTERALLLSDKRMRGYEGSPTIMDLINVENRSMDRDQVRDFYEAKITSGELRVVKTCHHIRVELGAGVSTLCSSCKEDRYWDVHMNFCPGCGASITK